MLAIDNDDVSYHEGHNEHNYLITSEKRLDIPGETRANLELSS